MRSLDVKQVVLAGGNPGIVRRLDPLFGVRSLQFHQNPCGKAAADLTRTVQPDAVVVMDPLPDASCDEFVGWVRRASLSHPTPRILILTERVEGMLGNRSDDEFIVMSVARPASELRSEVAAFLGLSSRGACRFMVRLEVHLLDGNVLRMVQAKDLSETGMFVRTNHQLPVGTTVGLRFSLPAESRTWTIVAQAEVVRRTSEETEEARGAGLRFVDFRTGDKRILQEYLRERRALAEACGWPERKTRRAKAVPAAPETVLPAEGLLHLTRIDTVDRVCGWGAGPA